jgi:hypothetical protein
MIFLKIGRMPVERTYAVRHLPKIGNAPRILPTNELTAEQLLAKINNEHNTPAISTKHTSRHARVFNEKNGGRRRTRKSRATKRRSRKNRRS